MPRKVLITKDTLEEILAKYQGGGSGGSVSVESNIVDVCFAGNGLNSGDELHLYMFKNDYQEWLENNNVTESELLSTFNNLSSLEQIGFLNTNIGAHFQNIKSIYQAVKLDNNGSLRQAISTSFVIDDLENPTVWSFSIEYIEGPGPENLTIVYDDIDLVTGLVAPTSGYDYSCTLSISTLDLVNVTGGQGGGTVEAEPIISIKMTNVDGRDIQEEQPNIVNLQFYCTKERWDNFVSLASSQFQVDITYANFDSVFKSINRQAQDFALGFLMMDYYDGKVLPNMYAYQVQSQSNLDAKIGIPSTTFITIKGQETNNIEIVAGCYFEGNFGCSIPNQDVSDVYTTANTVITVEEIDGPAIGSSSGSGTSDVLYKHTITGLIAEPDTPETDPEQVTLTFLSKHSNSFASNSSLVDFGASILNTDDANVIISPMIVGDSGGINVTVFPILVSGSLHQINILFPFSTSGNFFYQITASRNATGITDTVEPYIQVSGGSGSSASTEMQIWEFTFGVDVSIQVYTKFTQSDLSTMLADTNTSIDTINNMMGISLNHISSFNDIGTLITQSQTIDSTGALTETLIATFMSGLCSDKKTINVLKSDMFVRRTVVNCYPTITNQMATNYNCVVINNQNQFVTLQITGTNASAGYEEI